MILRRFTQHIKAQNWFAVLIEVIVVVVGIFLALQADQWKQSIDNAEKDKRSLELFSEELLTMIERVNGDISASKDSALMYDQLLGYLHDCSTIHQHRDFIIEVVKSGRRLRGLNVMRAGLDSIAQPTVLARLNNKELTRSVSRILELIDFWNTRHVIEAPELLSHHRQFSSHFEIVGVLGWQPDGEELVATNDSVEYRFDPDTICSNQEFRRVVRDLSIAHKRLYGPFVSWKLTLERAHKATELLLVNY